MYNIYKSGAMNMSKRLPLVVAGIIFSLVAIFHLLRLLYHWHVVMRMEFIPMSVSVCGLIVTSILALWMFLAAIKR